MLLQPRNSTEIYFQQMKLNIDDTPIEYFFCSDWECTRRESGSLLSTMRNQKCYCGRVLDKDVAPEHLSLGNGFVEETATFIISDDLFVMPNVLATVVHLHQKLGIDTNDTIVEQTVEISKKEVVDLLKLSLFSNSPLTDLILKKNQFVDKFYQSNQKI